MSGLFRICASGICGVVDMAEILSFIKEFGSFFVTNPVPMLSTAAIAIGAGYWFGSLVSKSNLAAKETRLEGLKDELETAKDRLLDAHKQLGLVPTGPNKYAAMTRPELQQCATNMCGDLFNLLETYNKNGNSLPQWNGKRFSDLSEDERKAAWDRYTVQLRQLGIDMMDTYNRRFRGDVVALYDEMRRRGGTVATGGNIGGRVFREEFLATPVNGLGIDAVAHALSTMVNTLPT
ncbi:hypothetical protein DF153_21025 [Burkholderia cenocepacia]|nr:hypothetical protein DF152_12995 [Burkholderia cenocepacia]RQU20991.1 hypothetical protein DF153_21025 [Burkholderia cenocepacia]